MRGNASNSSTSATASVAASSRDSGSVLPEEIAPVNDLPAAHVEQVDREHLVFKVIAKDVGVFIIGAGHALFILHLVNGNDLISQPRSHLKLLCLCCRLHPLCQRLLELVRPPLQKELHVADGFAVSVRCGQALQARSQAALDVILQASPRMISRQVNLGSLESESCDGSDPPACTPDSLENRDHSRLRRPWRNRRVTKTFG